MISLGSLQRYANGLDDRIRELEKSAAAETRAAGRQDPTLDIRFIRKADMPGDLLVHTYHENLKVCVDDEHVYVFNYGDHFVCVVGIGERLSD